jgi:two-component system, chemotaxis family, chemotaxis protein CheY
MRKTILVVDDFGSIRSFICDMLEKRGYATLPAQNGQEGFTLLLERHGKVDLVLTDYNMPDGSGEDLLNKIKQHPMTRKIPVVFLTTESKPEMILKAMEAGVADWIQKPYKPEIFFTKIENVLNSH